MSKNQMVLMRNEKQSNPGFMVEETQKKLTPVQQKILDLFDGKIIGGVKQHLKDVFQVAAFESEIWNNHDGKDSLYCLYHIIELLDDLEKEKEIM